MRIVFILALGASIVAVMARGADPKPSLTGVTVNPEKRTVTVAAKVAPRKLPKLDQVYPVELIAGWGAPKGAKAHEIVVAIDVNPSEVHKGLEALGLKPGKPAKGENAKAEGPLVNVLLRSARRGRLDEAADHGQGSPRSEVQETGPEDDLPLHRFGDVRG